MSAGRGEFLALARHDTSVSNQHLASIAIWAAAALITLFFALLLKDSAVIEGTYLPRTNDSLYHARRILDAALGDRGLYQFDERLHSPDGAWIPWPWAYDYLLAKVAQLALWIEPLVDPLAVISYVPVVWILVNAALFMAICSATRLPPEMRLLAMLCFALSPLTQLLHAVAMLDHHYVEHTFVLLTVWLGLRWFARMDSRGRAVGLGVALGFAPAFHNGLFILQLIPLGTLFLLWLRGDAPPRKSLLAFAAALSLATLLAVVPSEPFRRGMFEFGLLSWFHLYVACATSAAVIFMGLRAYSPRQLVVLGAVCLALAIPLARQVVSGAGFLAGSFSALADIAEVRSPYAMFESFGFVATISYYSWLLLGAPLLLAYYGYRAWRERTADRLYYAVAAVFGLALLLDQFRLHYFGFFALVTGSLLAVDTLRRRFGWHRGAVFVGAFAAIALAHRPSVERLFLFHAPGSEIDYANLVPLYEELGRLCADEPGVVLAHSDDGSPILFHSDCSVISNNFILRAEDERYINEIARLMRLSPAEIRLDRPDVKYLLLRTRDFVVVEDNTVKLAPSNPIAMQLLTNSAPPPGYELVSTVRWRMDDAGATAIFARLYKITPVGAPEG